MPSPDALYLLTGPTGFIGCRVREVLSERGHRLRVLSRISDTNALGFECFVGDLTDVSVCRQAMNGVNVVIHAAGVKRDSSRLWSVNVQGTKNLLTAALDEGVERFVHLSSVGVIGADPLQARVFDEDDICMPRNEYERSKLEAEKLVRQAGVSGLPVTLLRPANVFGDWDPERGLLTLARSVRDRRFAYLGGREAVCNYVFVEDVALAILTLAEHPDAVGSTYHLSDACTLGEFVDALAEELGVTRPSLEVPNLVARLGRKSLRIAMRLPQLSMSASLARLVSLNNQASFATSRLVDELGFDFPIGWRVGLKRVIGWYQSQGEL